MLSGTILGVNLWYHSMWFDELQAWGLARSSSDLLDIISRLGLEGHPALWHFTLFGLTRLTDDPHWMQVLTFRIGFASFGLVWMKSPFHVLEKLLLCLSFQYGYLFSVFSRPYGLGTLLILLFVASLPRESRTAWRGWLLLGLLANLHFYFFLSAVVLAIAWIGLEKQSRLLTGSGIFLVGNLFSLFCLTRIYSRDHAWTSILLTFALPLAIQMALWIAAGRIRLTLKEGVVGLSMASIVPLIFLWHTVGQANLGFFRILRSLKIWGTGFLPFRNPTAGNYWDIQQGLTLALILTLVTFAVVSYCLKSFPEALTLLSLQILAMSAVFVLRHGGKLWHVGVVFVTFMALVWMGRRRPEGLIHSWAIVVFLVPQAIFGVCAMGSSKLTPVSAAKETSIWLETNTSPDQRVYASELFPTSVVSNYLGRDLYFPSRGEGLKYSPWDGGVIGSVPYHILNDMKRSQIEEAFLVISFGAQKRTLAEFDEFNNELTLEEKARFTGMGLESFLVYRLTMEP